MTAAQTYSMMCSGCGLLEEHRVEDGTEPHFNMLEPRMVRDATGTQRTVAVCPLCGGRMMGDVRSE